MLAHASGFHSNCITGHYFYNLAPISLALLLIILTHWGYSESVDCFGIQVCDYAFVLGSLVNLPELLLVVDSHSYPVF